MSFSSAMALQQQLRRLASLLSNAADSGSDSSQSEGVAAAGALDVQSPMNITVVGCENEEEKISHRSALHAAADALSDNENNFYAEENESGYFPPLPDSRAPSVNRQGGAEGPTKNRVLLRSTSASQHQARIPSENELFWVTSGLSVGVAKWDAHLREYPEVTGRPQHVRRPTRSVSAGRRVDGGTNRSGSAGSRPDVRSTTSRSPPPPPLPSESSRRGSTATSTVEDVAELRHRLRILKSRYESQLQKKKVEEGKVARLRRPAPSEIIVPPPVLIANSTEGRAKEQSSDLYPPPSPSRVEASFIANSSMRSALNHSLSQMARSASAPASPSRQRPLQTAVESEVQQQPSSNSDEVPSALFRALTTRPISRRFSSSAASSSTKLRPDARDARDLFASASETSRLRSGTSQSSPRGLLGPRLWAVYGGGDDPLMSTRIDKGSADRQLPSFTIDEVPTTSLVPIPEAEALLTPKGLLDGNITSFTYLNHGDVSRPSTSSLLLSKRLSQCLRAWERAETRASRRGAHLEISEELGNNTSDNYVSIKSTSKRNGGFSFRSSTSLTSSINRGDIDDSNELEKDSASWPLPSTGRVLRRLLSLADAGSVALLAQRAVALINADCAVRDGAIRVRTLRAVRSLIFVEAGHVKDELAVHLERLNVVSMEEESQRVLVDTFGPTGKSTSTTESIHQTSRQHTSLSAAAPSAAYTLALLSDLKLKLIVSAPFVALKKNAHMASTLRALLDQRCSVVAKCGLKLLFARHAFASALRAVRLSAARAIHVSSRLASTKRLMASWHLAARKSAEACAREAVADRRGRLSCLGRAFRALNANRLSRIAQRHQAMMASVWSRGRMLAEAFRGWSIVVRNNKAIHERMDAALLSEQRATGRGGAPSKNNEEQSNHSSSVSIVNGLLPTPSLTSALRILRQSSIAESFAQKYKHVAVKSRQVIGADEEDVPMGGIRSNSSSSATTVRNIASAARGYALRSRQRRGLEETARSLLIRSRINFESAASLLMLPSLTSGGGVRGGATGSTVRAIDSVLVLLRKSQGDGERLNENHVRSITSAEDRLIGALGSRFRTLADALVLIRRSARQITFNDEAGELKVDDEDEEEDGPSAANQAGAIRAAYSSTCILDPVLVAHAKIEEHKKASLDRIQSRSGLTWPHAPYEQSTSYHSHGCGPLWTRLPRNLLGLPSLLSRTSSSFDNNDENDQQGEGQQVSDEEEEMEDIEEDDPASHFNVGSDSLRMRAKALAEANRLPPDWTQYLHGASKARAEAALSTLRQPLPVGEESSSKFISPPLIEGAIVGRTKADVHSAVVTPHKILSPLTRRVLSKGAYIAQALQVNVSPVGSVESSPAKVVISSEDTFSPSITLDVSEKTIDETDDVDVTISARAATIYALRLLKAVIRSWARAARTCKLSKKLRALWVDRRQRSAFISWKRYHEERQLLISSVRNVGERIITRRYFLALREYLRSSFEKRETKARDFNRRRVLRSSFSAFQSYAALQRRDRALCAIADASNVKRLLQKTFFVWKGRFVALQPIRAFARRMAHINGIRAARLLWPTWRNLVDRRKLLRRVFSGAERRRNEQIAFEATRHERAFVAMAETLREWSAFAKEETVERQLRAAEYSAEALWRVRRLVKAVITWKQSAAVAARARELRSRCLRKFARLHLRAWIGLFLKHRAALLRLQMRWEVTVPLQRTLSSWRQLALERRNFYKAQTRRLLQRWHFSVQAIARGGIEITDISKSLQQEVLTMETTTRLKRSFLHWRRRVSEWARIRSLQSAAVTALADRKKRAVLLQLAAWAERRTDLKRRIKEAGSTPLHLIEKRNADSSAPLPSSVNLSSSPATGPIEIFPVGGNTSLSGVAEALDLSVVEPPPPRLRTVLVLPPQPPHVTPPPVVSRNIVQSGIRSMPAPSSQKKASEQESSLVPMTSMQRVSSSSEGRTEVATEASVKVTVSTQTSLTSPAPSSIAPMAASSKAVVRAAASVPLFPDYSQQRANRISPAFDSLGSRRGSDADTDSIEAGDRPRAFSLSSTSSLDLLTPTPMLTAPLFDVPPLSIVAFHPEFLNSSPEEERFRFWARTSLAAERINLQTKPSAPPPPPPPPPPPDEDQHEDQGGGGGRQGKESGNSNGISGSVFASIATRSTHVRRQQALETSLTPHDRSSEIMLDRISSRIREAEVEERVVALAGRVRGAIAAQEALQGRSSAIAPPLMQPRIANLISSPPGILTASLLLMRGENDDDDDLDSLFAKPVVSGETEDVDSLVKEDAPNDERFRLAQAVRDASNRVSELLSLTSSRQGSSRSNDSESPFSENTIKEDSVSRATSGSIDSLVQSAVVVSSAPVMLPTTTALLVRVDSTSRALNFEETAFASEDAATSAPSLHSYSSDSLPASTDDGSNSSPLSVMKIEPPNETANENEPLTDGAAETEQQDSITPKLGDEADSLSSRDLVDISGHHNSGEIARSAKHISVNDDEVELEEAFGDQDVSRNHESKVNVEEMKNSKNSSPINHPDGFSIKTDSLESIASKDKEQQMIELYDQKDEEKREACDSKTIRSHTLDVLTSSSSPSESLGKISSDDIAQDSIANASRGNTPDSVEKAASAGQREDRSSVVLTESSTESEDGGQQIVASVDNIKDSLEGSIVDERDSLSTVSLSPPPPPSFPSSSSSSSPLPQAPLSHLEEENDLIHGSDLSLSNEQFSIPSDSVAISASIENDSISCQSASFASPFPPLQPSALQVETVSSLSRSKSPQIISKSEDLLGKENIEADVPYLLAASAAPSPVRIAPKFYSSSIADEVEQFVDAPRTEPLSLSVSVSESIDSLAASVRDALSEDSVNKDVRVAERYNKCLMKRMLTQWRASAFLQSQRRGVIYQGFERLTCLLTKRAKAVRMAECELYALSIKRVEAEVKALYARKAALLNSSMDEVASITAQSILTSDSLLSRGTIMSGDSLLLGSPVAAPQHQASVDDLTRDVKSEFATQVPVYNSQSSSYDSDSLHSNHLSDDSLAPRMFDTTNGTNSTVKQQKIDSSGDSSLMTINSSLSYTQVCGQSSDSLDSLHGGSALAEPVVVDTGLTPPVSTSKSEIDVISALPTASSESPAPIVNIDNQEMAAVNTPLTAPPIALSISSTARSSKSSKSSTSSRSEQTTRVKNPSTSSAASRRSSAGSTPSTAASTATVRGVVLPLSPPPSSKSSRSSKREKAPPVASPPASTASIPSSSTSSSSTQSARSTPSLTASVKTSSMATSVKSEHIRSTSSSSSSSSITSEHGSISAPTADVVLESMDTNDLVERANSRRVFARPNPKPSSIVPQKDMSIKSDHFQEGDQPSKPLQVELERPSSTLFEEKSPPTIVRSRKKPQQEETRTQTVKKEAEAEGSLSITEGKKDAEVESPSSSLSSDSLYASSRPSLLLIPAASPDSINNIHHLPQPQGSTISPDSLNSRSISPQKFGVSRHSPDSLNKVSPLVSIRASSVSPSFVTIKEEEEEEEEEKGSELLGGSLQVSETSSAVTNSTTGLQVWSPPPLPLVSASPAPLTVSSFSSASTEVSGSNLQTWTAPPRAHVTSKNLSHPEESNDGSGIAGLTTISDVEETLTHADVAIPDENNSTVAVEKDPQLLPQKDGLLVPPGYVALLMPASRLHGGRKASDLDEGDDETVAVLVPDPSSAGRLNQPRYNGVKSYAGASSSPSAFMFSPTTMELLRDIRGVMRSGE